MNDDAEKLARLIYDLSHRIKDGFAYDPRHYDAADARAEIEEALPELARLYQLTVPPSRA